MQNGYEVFFLDESGFLLIDYKIYGWYQKGSNPIKQYIFNGKRRTYIASAFSTKGYIISSQFESINGNTFLQFVKSLKARFPKLVLIMDNVSTHFTKDLMKWYEENKVIIIKFPKYSPQLNPVEQYWKNLKQLLGTIQPFTFEELKNTLDVLIKDISLWPNSYGYLIT
jgi:transposase